MMCYPLLILFAGQSPSPGRDGRIAMHFMIATELSSYQGGHGHAQALTADKSSYLSCNRNFPDHCQSYHA